MRCIRNSALLLLSAGAANSTQFGTHLDATNVYYQSDRANAIARAKQINVQIARNTVWWNNVQTYRGRDNWGVIEAAVDEQRAAGIEPLVTLVGSPAWANGADPNQFEFFYQIPGDPGAFSYWVGEYASFAASAAQRLKGRVTKWELWNEENEHFTWQPFPNPDQYAAWYRAVYQAIKSVDPSAEISIGGLTGLAASGPNDYNGLQFLQELYNRGVYPDFVAIHPYTSSNQAPDQFYQWQNNFTDIGRIHDEMAANGQGDKPLWLTEWGWETSVVGESAQAAYVERALNMIRSDYPYVTVSTYFLQSDQGRYSSGLFDSDGRLREAGARFRDVISSANAPQAAENNVRYVSDLQYIPVRNDWGPVERDRSNGETAAGDGHTLSINGARYSKGLGVHSASEVDVNLGGMVCSSFSSDVGVDDETGGRGALSFQLWGDDELLFDSGVIFGGNTARTANVGISGRQTLRLIVNHGPYGMDYGHGDWANAKLSCN